MKSEKLNEILSYVSKALKIALLAACVVLLIITCKTCSDLKTQKRENTILNNNVLAMNDTLKNYKENGYNIAEMRAMQIKIDELTDSLKLERNRMPVTIVQYVSTLNDTFTAYAITIHDTCYVENTNISDAGTIKSIEHSQFEKSSRYIEINTPYTVNCADGKAYADGESDVYLQQNIWVENVLYKDKDGYTYIRLKTDYPGITFNSGSGILVLDPKEEKQLRRQFGLGIGLQLGYGATYTNNAFKAAPYIGIGIGLQWNPRFLQF